MKRILRQFVLVLSLVVASMLLVPVHAQQRRAEPPSAPKTERQADDAAKKGEKEAAQRRTDEDKKQEQASKRREQEDRKREEAAKRRDAEDQKRRETATRRTGDDHQARGRDDDHRQPAAEPRRPSGRPKSTRVVFVGGYFYDPFFGPYPWWPPAVYPYRWAPRFDGRAHVRVIASPKDAAVYVDGFYAGIVDDFDGLFQPLPLLPGGHTIALYLDGYRTVNKSVYLTPGSTLKLREELERLPPGVASAPPAVVPMLPPPPPGTYVDVRTPPREQPRPPALPPEAPPSGFGVLSLRIQPPDAIVTVDGQEWLSTEPGQLVIQVSAGRHMVTVGMPERPHFSKEVDVRDGETTELNVSVPPRATH
jgi:hypothetical protein